MLLASHKRDKAHLADTFGVEYPAWFIHPAAEYQSLTCYAGALDLTHWRVLRLTGKDRLSFLNAMLTNDVAALGVDHGCHSLLTTIKGKIIAELHVFARDSDVLVLISQGDAAEVLAVLEKHIIMEDVTIEDVSDANGIIAIEGPKLDDTMWRLFEKGPFPKVSHQAFARQFLDTDIYVMRNNVTGVGGYHMLMPSSAVERMWGYIVQGIRGTDGLAIGSLAWNMCRIETGLPWYGVDFDDGNFPDECRLGSTISYTKGCFRGQETLARLHNRGHVNRMLVGMTTVDTPAPAKSLAAEFEGEINNYDEAGLQSRAEALAGKLGEIATCRPGAEIFAAGDDSKAIGHVTSAAFSPRLGRPLLLGYVRREVVEAGADLTVAEGPAVRLVDLPLPAE